MPSTVKPILVLSDDGSGVSQLGSFGKEYLAKYNSDNSFGFFACEYLSVYYICRHPDPPDLHYFYLPLLDFDPVFEGRETPCRFLLPVPPIHNIEESREAGKEEKMMECNYSQRELAGLDKKKSYFIFFIAVICVGD